MSSIDSSIYWPPDVPRDEDIGIANIKVRDLVVQLARSRSLNLIVQLLCTVLESGECDTIYFYALEKRRSEDAEIEFDLQICIDVIMRNTKDEIGHIAVEFTPNASATIINRLREEDRVAVAHDAITDYLIAQEKVENNSEGEVVVNGGYDEEDGDEDCDGLESYFAELEKEDPMLYFALRNIHRRVIGGMLDENLPALEEE